MIAKHYLKIFQEIGSAFNSPMETKELLETISKSIVENLALKGCHFLLVGRDRKTLDYIASYGLSEKFRQIFQPGSLDPEKSISEGLEGKIVLIDDASHDPRIQHPRAHAEEGIVSLLTIPLSSRDRVIGTVRLSSAERRTFTADELEILQIVASFSASAILHSIFKGILKRVIETVRSSLDINAVLNSIVKVVTEEMRVKGSTIRLLNSDRSKLELRASYGMSRDYLDKGPVDADKSIAETLTGKSIVIYDAPNNPKLQYPDAARKEQINSILSVPLMVHKHPLGVLRIYSRFPFVFSEDEIHLMETIGDQCALIIRNAEMYTGVKQRYDVLMSDFHQWFDQLHPTPGPRES
ncbi:MAG: GAF domain-containing protein [Thermodesulfobacteriota bacterium]